MSSRGQAVSVKSYNVTRNALGGVDFLLLPVTNYDSLESNASLEFLHDVTGLSKK
jgi:hypothetical protein